MHCEGVARQQQYLLRKGMELTLEVVTFGQGVECVPGGHVIDSGLKMHFEPSRVYRMGFGRRQNVCQAVRAGSSVHCERYASKGHGVQGSLPVYDSLGSARKHVRATKLEGSLYSNVQVLVLSNTCR